MRSLMGFVLLSMILALTLEIAFTVQAEDKFNATGSLDKTTPMGDSANESMVLLNNTNTTDALNSTKLNDTIMLENITTSENVSSEDRVVINASAHPFDTKPSGKVVFVIDNGVTPIKRAGNIGGASSVNGASLMRAVDQTPHGYTTYYN